MNVSGKTLAMLGILIVLIAAISTTMLENEVISAIIAVLGGALMLYGNSLAKKQKSQKG